MSAPSTFYHQQAPYAARKGFVVPPQEMPPKNGFFFPKYRMSTLSAKGLTTYQIVGVFIGATVYGTMQLIDHSEWRNARTLTQTAQLMAQSTLFNILYGKPQRIVLDADPKEEYTRGINILPQAKGRDKRPEILVSSIMTEDRRRLVDMWRQATQDPAVAPYKVCYGPEHYANHHVCSQYCILPQEVKQAKELLALEKAKQQATTAPSQHHH